MNVWITFLVAGLITYGIRLSMILLLDKLAIPERVMQALRFVPPAVFSAIILPDIFWVDGAFTISPINPRLLAALAAALVAWKSRSVILTLIVGMGLLLLIKSLIPG